LLTVPQNNCERYHFADFTRENYRRLLRLAKQNYVFRSYTDFARDERFIIWRHDVDFSMHSARKLAQIEAEESVRATYFLYLHSEFYNLLEREITDCVWAILALGHRIGLHFDSHYYGINSEAQFAPLLRREKRILEEFFEQEIKVFSIHIPTPFTLRCRQWQYAGLINTNADYFQTQVGYCSDSNGYWRFRRLEDVLQQATDERLQVLTHPEMWQDTVMSPKQRVYRCIEGRAEKTRQWYDAVLKESGRENIDWD
jgi:hypothetical protein